MDEKDIEKAATQYGLENPFFDYSGEGKDNYDFPKIAFKAGAEWYRSQMESNENN